MSDADAGRGVRRRFGRSKEVEPATEITERDVELEGAVREPADGVRHGGQLTPSADEPFVAESPPDLPHVGRGRARRRPPSDTDAVLVPLPQEVGEAGRPTAPPQPTIDHQPLDDTTESERARWRGKLDSLGQKVDELGDQLSRERDEANQRAAEAEARSAELLAARAGDQEQVERYAAELATAHAQVADLANQLAAVQHGVEQWTSDREALAHQLAAIESERDEASRQVAELGQGLDAERSRSAGLAAARDELQHELDVVMDATTAIEDRLRRWAERLPPSAPEAPVGS